ncbi:flavin reductase family protein [Knoellia sp. S7-12]|uniref:flavin reductase family protein n=1 Tax=Knoellia sp. S7-12 TaxID=3126698 RepID=UPI0033689236
MTHPDVAPKEPHAGIDPALYRETLGHYPTGVAVVTGIADDGLPAGMVVGSFTSVSLDPPLVAFLPTRDSGSFARLRTGATFCINVLAADQESTCRRFASRAVDKFEGVAWSPAPGGAPILDGAVSWIECTYEDVLDGGDHYIVLGRIRDLAVARPSLPLLFFQGGYGRFAPPSLVAPSHPDLIHAVRLAELARGDIEQLSAEHEVDCAVLAKVGGDVVFVLTANRSEKPTTPSVGHRVPLVPPLGSVFLRDAPEEDVNDWLARAPGQDDATREVFRRNVDRVRERGYSVSLMPDPSVDRISLMTDYSSTERTPQHERRMKQMIADTALLYEPDLEPDRTYHLHSIVVPVPVPPEMPQIAMRMSGLPTDASLAQLDAWVDALSRAANTAAARLCR